MRISDWSSDVCSSDLLLTEIGIGVVDRADLARLGGVEQAHRAPREDSAIALQLRGPGAVRYLVRERLGDVDRVRVESLQLTRGAAYAGVLFGFLAIGAGVGVLRVPRGGAHRERI